MEDRPEKENDRAEKDDEKAEPPIELDKDHGEELPENPEGNVETMVERGRQMGF